MLSSPTKKPHTGASSESGEMSTDLHRAVGHLELPVLEVRFHYKPSMGTTTYTLVPIGFPWVPSEGEQ